MNEKLIDIGVASSIVSVLLYTVGYKYISSTYEEWGVYNTLFLPSIEEIFYSGGIVLFSFMYAIIKEVWIYLTITIIFLSLSFTLIAYKYPVSIKKLLAVISMARPVKNTATILLIIFGVFILFDIASSTAVANVKHKQINLEKNKGIQLHTIESVKIYIIGCDAIKCAYAKVENDTILVEFANQKDIISIKYYLSSEKKLSWWNNFLISNLPIYF